MTRRLAVYAVEDRVVVERDPLQVSARVEAHVLLLEHVLDPAAIDPVGAGAERLIGELEPEPGRGQTERPGLGVLAVGAVGSLRPLRAEVVRDPAVRPREGPVLEPGHLERPVPGGLARHLAVDREHQVEEAAEEEVPGRSDRIRLESPGLDTVRGPAGRVVAAPEILRDQPLVRLRVARPVRVGADLGEPVDRRPVGGVPAQQLVEDPGVDLAPGGRLAGEQQQGVRRLGEVEAREGEHRRQAVPVPPGMRLAAARPVVGRHGLAPQEAEPAAHFARKTARAAARHESSRAW